MSQGASEVWIAKRYQQSGHLSRRLQQPVQYHQPGVWSAVAWSMSVWPLSLPATVRTLSAFPPHRSIPAAPPPVSRPRRSRTGLPLPTNPSWGRPARSHPRRCCLGTPHWSREEITLIRLVRPRWTGRTGRTAGCPPAARRARPEGSRFTPP
ncbi:hypothetical protein N658DRAFT_332822 [Parathielavia hyrcaniae]|uniref:Uncharacterized protein n=1 Tax=Parathielavia hyrcaniae TaxID=113614 RepID=A0AAN6PRW1_9PEZI|nr:hypothetical protein N658DRAFT_332822 [Parathielavia hyrcaniae]